MEERGVIYYAWGDEARRQAMRSIMSLWHHNPDMPILILGSEKTRQAFDGCPPARAEIMKVDPFRKTKTRRRRPWGMEFLAGRVSPLLYGLSPFQLSLYVDTDTEFVASPEPWFRWLENWDIVVTETQFRSVNNFHGDPMEFGWTRWFLGGGDIIYHNAGIFAWRRNEAVKKLFHLWSEEWARFQNWDPQVALLRALARSEALFLTLPYTWNCRDFDEAKYIYHQFGQMASWKQDWGDTQ